MQIVVISVSKPQYKTKGKSKWSEIVLSYNSDKGEKERKFPSFHDLYKQIEDLEIGCTYEVRLEKDGDYFQWVGIEKVEGVAPQPKVTSSAGGNQWADKNALDRERFEFEKQKQILIIRQSMVAAAVDLVPQDTICDAVIEVAERFVQYVLNGPVPEEKRKPGRPKKEEPVEQDEDPDVE